MGTSRLAPILAMFVLATAACSSSAEPTDTAATDPSTTAAATESAAVTTTSNAAPSTTAAAELATTTTSAAQAAEVLQGEPLIPGFPAITVLTPSAGGGTRPLLRWEAVADAAFYSVVVYDGVGEPYWATLTDELQTYVGGPIQILEDRPGPRVSEGGAWSVVALDAEGSPLAASGVAPIGP